MSTPAGLPQVQEDVAGIAELAEAAAHGEYDTLVVRADFSQDGVAEMEGDLVRAQEVLPLNVASGALDLFSHMRGQFVAAGQPVWTTAEVTVEGTGAATVRFSYSDRGSAAAPPGRPRTRHSTAEPSR